MGDESELSKEQQDLVLLSLQPVIVESGSEEYSLTVERFTGVGTDWFVSVNLSNGMKFSTLDNDNDKDSKNCAATYKSGWWHNNCFMININTQPPYYSWPNTALFTEMKIFSKYYITQ